MESVRTHSKRFMNLRGNGHVNAALQGLLHSSVVQAVVEDRDHWLRCRSLLKCMSCALFRILKEEGPINPVYFINKWEAMSSNLPLDSRKNPYDVFHMFLTRLRLEQCQRLPSITLEDLYSSKFTSPFQGYQVSQVLCVSCGLYEKKSPFLSVEIESFEESVADAILNCLVKKESKAMCMSCLKYEGSESTIKLELPQYLIVNFKRKCPPGFTLPLSFDLNTHLYKFQYCMFQTGDTSLFIALSPDGHVRKIEDTEIKCLSIGTLISASTFIDGYLTIIFSEEIVKIERSAAQRSSKLFKVISAPNLDCDLYSNLPKGPSSKTVGTQTDVVYKDQSVQVNIEEPMVSFKRCKTHPQFEFFTGLTVEDFEAFHDFLGGEDVIRRLKLFYRADSPKKLKKSKLSSHDRLLLFLVRFRRGLPLEDLSFVFGISDSYAGELCYVMTRLIYLSFKELEQIMFLPAAAQKKKKPAVMMPFQNLRVIIDGADFFLETPSNFEQQGNTYCAYKGTNTLRFIVGVSCHGSTIFCSEGYEGSISDRVATLQSGLLEMLDPMDGVMADRGFADMVSDFQARGAVLYKPPDKSADKAATPEEEIFTKQIAAARIYVEHAIGDMKDNRLLRGNAPLTMLPVRAQLVYIAAFLRNFSTKIIRSKSISTSQEKSDS